MATYAWMANFTLPGLSETDSRLGPAYLVNHPLGLLDSFGLPGPTNLSGFDGLVDPDSHLDLCDHVDHIFLADPCSKQGQADFMVIYGFKTLIANQTYMILTITNVYSRSR